MIYIYICYIHIYIYIYIGDVRSPSPDEGALADPEKGNRKRVVY